MTAVTFDTLKFVKTLQAAGVSAPQAEAFASAVRDSTESADLATPHDLHALDVKIDARFAEAKADMRELRAQVDTRFAKVEGELRELRAEFSGKFILLQWMLGVVVAGVLALVMKAFLHA